MNTKQKGTNTNQTGPCFIIGILLLQLDEELSVLLQNQIEFQTEISQGVNFKKNPLAQVVLAGVVSQCSSAGIGALLFQKALKVLHYRYTNCMLLYAVCENKKLTFRRQLEAGI